MTLWFSLSKALIVRCALVVHVILCTWRVTVNMKNSGYWLLLCILIPLMGESFYTIYKRHGREFSRFTPCFFFYLGAVLPGIWLLELDRTDKYIQGVDSQALDPTDETVPGSNLSIWLIVIEELMPYVIFISRWILPRGKLTREELAELLFTFIEIGADIMEFFSLLDENVIRGDITLVYSVLGIWSLSVLQFTTPITFIYHPRSENAVRHGNTDRSKDQEWKRNKHEIVAIFTVIAVQDLPFAIMRLYTIIKFNRINYSLIFFTAKNLLIIVLLLYKVTVLCKVRYCPDLEEDSDKIIVVGRSEGIDEAERGNVGRKSSFAGSLSRFSINSEKPVISFDDSFTPRAHSSFDEESGLKKRKGNHQISYSELNDQGTCTHVSNDMIIEPHVYPLPKPHKPAQSGQYPSDFLPVRYSNITADPSNPLYKGSNFLSIPSYPSREEPAKGTSKQSDDLQELQKSLTEPKWYSSEINRSSPRRPNTLSHGDEASIQSFNSQSSIESILSPVKNRSNKEKNSFKQLPELISKDNPHTTSENTPVHRSPISPRYSKPPVLHENGRGQIQPIAKVQGPHISVIRL